MNKVPHVTTKVSAERRPWWPALGVGLVRPVEMNAPALLLLAAALMAQLVVSPEPALGWPRFWGIVLQVALFFGLVHGLRSRSAVVQGWRVATTATGLMALLGLVSTDWSQIRLLRLPFYQQIPVWFGRSHPLFHPTEIGIVMAVLLPLPLAYLLFGRERSWRAASAAVVFMAASVLLISQASMGYLGLALALCLMAIWWRRWTIVPIVVGAAGLAGAVLAYGPQRLALTLLDMDHPVGIGFILRFDMWSRALAMARDMPFTGIGLNAFPLVQTHFYTGYLIGPEYHSHNLFLQTLIDLGLPGLLALLWLLLAFAVMVVRAYRETEAPEMRVLLVALAAGALAYVGSGTLDVTMFGFPSITALWLLFGLAGAIRALAGREAAPGRAAAMGRVWEQLAGLVLFMAILIVAAAALPAVWYGNLGALQAHQALYQARTAGTLPAAQAERAVAYLQYSLSRRPDQAQFYGLLGSLYAWQGDQPQALEALERRVALDGPQALDDYAPFELWRRQLLNEAAPAPWESTAHLYSQWSTRFPNRAESIVLRALVRGQQQGNGEQAAGLLQAGLDQGAEPRGLLEYAGEGIGDWGLR